MSCFYCHDFIIGMEVKKIQRPKCIFLRKHGVFILKPNPQYFNMMESTWENEKQTNKQTNSEMSNFAHHRVKQNFWVAAVGRTQEYKGILLQHSWKQRQQPLWKASEWTHFVCPKCLQLHFHSRKPWHTCLKPVSAYTKVIHVPFLATVDNVKNMFFSNW